MMSVILKDIFTKHPDALLDAKISKGLLCDLFPEENKKFISGIAEAQALMQDDVLRGEKAWSKIDQSSIFAKLINEKSIDAGIARNCIKAWCDYFEIDLAINEKEFQEEKKQFEEEGTIGYVGIDLGTTNTVVSYFDLNNELCNLKVGNSTTIPSVLFFESEKEIYFGNNALKRVRKNSQSVVRLFKRKIGDPKEKINVVFNRQEDTASASIGKTYVIDTNCFVDEPGILGYFDKNDTVILPITVTQELGFRERQTNTKYTAKQALENIAAANEKYACKIEFQESDLSLLPQDFFTPVTQNDQNDDKVLSIAIKNKERNAILVTSDKALGIVKAQTCGIESIRLNDFKLNRLPKVQKKDDKFVLSGEQATSYFLRFIKDEIAKTLSCDLIKAVITVPDNFNNIQVEATKRAAKEAGFNEVYIEKEPIAAAIAYAMDQEQSKKILVYDFGGGTFDVAIVNYDKDKNEFETLSTDGDPQLGGQDITEEFVQYIFDILDDECGLTLYSLEESGLDEVAYFANLSTIENEAERVKKSLSVVEEEDINLINLYTPDGAGLTKKFKITKGEFEDVVSDIVRKPTACVERAINEASIKAEDIDVVILSGGTSHTPIVKEKVQNFFGKMPLSNKDPATLIANGAAIIAQDQFAPVEVFEEEDTASDAPIKKKSITRKTKVVADIGIATDDYDFDCVIEHGKELPASGVKTYYLLEDNQQAIDIKVYSRKKNNSTTKAIHCDYIDKITLGDLPPLKRKETLVEVTFTITEEYELSVSAEVKDHSGKVVVEPTSITIDKESVR